MSYQWRGGYHAPHGVSADEVGKALEKLPEPTPDALLEASKNKHHILHQHLWTEGDQVWAQKARYEECRHIIAGVRKVDIIGGKEISYRPVEFLREQGEGRWARMSDIVADESLHDAYMAEIERLQSQAVAKMQTFRALLKQKK